MSAGTQHVITSGAVATSTTAKTVLSLIAGASISPTLAGLDISSDSTVTAGSYVVELVKFTADGTGSAVTAQKGGGKSVVVSTSKANDTVEPTTATVIKSWYVPASQLASWQYPLGREFSVDVSTLIGVRITAPSGTPNVRVNIDFEE